MQDSFVNRLAMFQTSLATLHSPEYHSVWSSPPAIFRKKVNEAVDAVTALESFSRQLETTSEGATALKRREQAELEEIAYVFGSSLAIWFTDQNDQQNAAQVDLSASQWRRLRDQTLLAKARIVLQLAEGVASGPASNAATEYGITLDEIENLRQEIEDFASVISAPQQTIAQSAGLRKQLRDRFNEVENKFQTLDRLILHFRRTEVGRNLNSAYEKSRIIIDRGRGAANVETRELAGATN